MGTRIPSGNYSSEYRQFDTSTRSRLVVKIAMLFSGLVLLVIITSGLISYLNHREKILTNLQNQLQLAANTVAISINGDVYASLKGRESMGTPAYQNVKQALQRFLVNRYLGFEENNVYTFRRISPDSLEFTVMLQEEYVGNRYGIRPEMLPTLEKGIPSYTGIYEDENGMWLSAYSPIFNSRNEVVGMVEVDFHNNLYLMAINDELYSLIALGLGGILLAVLVAVILSRVITRPITQIAEAAIRFSRGDLGARVAVPAGDEIGMLARAFNYMVEEIREKESIRQENRELSEAYCRLDAANQRLQEANRLKSEFLSIAAHDLKSPLQVIMGFAEHILMTPGQSDTVYHDAEKIFRGTERMLRIVKQLLDTTALESGKLTLHKSRIDVGELAKRVVQQNQPLAERKQQKIHFSAQQSCFAVVDADRMCEVLDNLLNNAIKFSPPGKDIYVTVENVSGNGGVRLSVRDEGPGLSVGDQKKMFGKFVRLSAQPTNGESSTGLGLSLVKQLVELHGGRVWVHSAGKGGGATFFVEIQRGDD